MQGKKLSVIRRWIAESVDLDWYERMYALQLFMSGDRDTIKKAQEGRVLRYSLTSSRHGEGELPDFAEIMPPFGEVGTQNHGLVNARINVQGLSMEPEFLFQHQDPVVRQVNAAFLRDRWVQQRWDEQWFMTGVEVEACGISSCHCGVDDDMVNWRHVPILDTLFDRSHKAPSDWKWVCVRNRLTPEEAEEMYGSALSDDDLKLITTQENVGETSRDAPRIEQPAKQVIEWCYYDRDDHVAFLNAINGGKSIALKLDKNGRYRKIQGTDPTAGPNPWGIIPHAFWVDFWAPSVRRPVGKMETTMRLAAMLNEVESYMVNTLREGVPITAIDTNMVDDPKLAEEIKSAKSARDLKRVLLMSGNIREALHRTDPAELPQIVLALRSFLKEEINASTGVGDMQRGQALAGERKTREEIRTLADQSGVQARHFKRQFAKFVEDVVSVTRPIAAMYDKKRTLLNLEDYDAIDTSMVPIQPFLSEYLPCQVLPESLGFKTDQDRQQDAVTEFTQAHLPYIQLGVLDPVKSMVRILKHWGIKDPLRDLGIDPQQMAMRQMMGPGGAPPPAGGAPIQPPSQPSS